MHRTGHAVGKNSGVILYHSISWLLAFMLACLLFALACLRPVNGAAVRPIRATALTIDFDSAQAPVEMRAAITQAILNRPTLMLPGQSFAVLSLRVQDDWALATLGVMDANLEAAGMGRDGAMLVLARGGADGSWQSALEDTPTFQALVAHTPDTLLDARAKQALQPADALHSPQDVTLLFPWDRSQRWYLTHGWHSLTSGNYVDFAPLSSMPNKWVLAAHDGVITRACLGPLTANVELRHSSGLVTSYAHLDITSVISPLLGTTVSQGRVLGLAYNKAFSSTQDHCGYSTGPHVHFGLPSQNSIVDGWTTHPDNTWTKAGVTRQVNASFDSTNVLNRGPGFAPRAFIPLLRR
jgi:murein DD-endopeptidase MepM/ murein hydrolase activator NlpD